jgi:hypothetical protein
MFVATVVGCRDITKPAGSNVVSGKPRASVSPLGTVTVLPSSMAGWVFYDDQHDTACTNTAVCQMVAGPANPPSGSGSAELATPLSGDGNALVLSDYSGTRLDQISDLKYSTFRQSVDAGNNLAIALQINVDYDLTDASTGYQGRLVFEPYQAAGGSVPQATWQTWDAKSGKWWGTRSSVPKNGTLVANPCVQATPCTWTQLLVAFPNAGVHAIYGALVLKAGSGWAGFRGNVDKLTIGIAGAVTTFDFEPTATATHLHTEIEAGVSGTRLPADSDYAAGSAVNYSFTAASGFDSLLVVVDDTLAAASGTVSMDRPHTIRAGADPILVPNAGASAMRAGLTALLTANDKPAAFSDFLQMYLDRSQLVGADSADSELALATYLAIDPYRDAAALVAVDNALTGNVSAIDHFGGRDYTYYYTPDTFGFGIERRGRSNPAARRRTGTHFVPRAVLERGVGGQRSSGKSALSSATSAPWPTEFTAIVYINGILTPRGSLIPTPTGAVGSYNQLKNLVFGIPRFQDVLDPSSSSNTEVLYFYNRTLSAQLQAFNEANHCVATYERDSGVRAVVRRVVNYARCKGIEIGYSISQNDAVESLREYLQLTYHIGSPNSADADGLANMISTFHGEFGEHLIFATHSQGNMLLAQAIQLSPAKEGKPLQSGFCTAELSFASPILKANYPGLDTSFMRGFTMNGDILDVLGLKTDFPKLDTDRSIAALAELGPQPITDEPSEKRSRRLEWGKQIHDVDYNYLTYPASRDSVASMLGQLDDECTVQSAEAVPSALTLPLGDSAQLALNVMSRASHLLQGRGFNGGGLGSVINEKLMVIATAPTHGVENAPLNLQSTGQTFGHVSVTVPDVSFPGRIVEHRSTFWDAVGGFSDNTTTNVPPFPAAPPSWDGTPAACSDTTQTGDAHAYTIWAQRCNRWYGLEIPADPLPVRTRVRLLYGDYPTGAFHGDAFSFLLPQHVAVADTLPYHCGPEYCLRAAVLETRNTSNIIMTSDTTCFSDRCNSSLNRTLAKPAKRPNE